MATVEYPPCTKVLTLEPSYLSPPLSFDQRAQFFMCPPPWRIAECIDQTVLSASGLQLPVLGLCCPSTEGSAHSLARPFLASHLPLSRRCQRGGTPVRIPCLAFLRTAQGSYCFQVAEEFWCQAAVKSVYWLKWCLPALSAPSVSWAASFVDVPCNHDALNV